VTSSGLRVTLSPARTPTVQRPGPASGEGPTCQGSAAVGLGAGALLAGLQRAIRRRLTCRGWAVHSKKDRGDGPVGMRIRRCQKPLMIRVLPVRYRTPSLPPISGTVKDTSGGWGNTLVSEKKRMSWVRQFLERPGGVKADMKPDFGLAGGADRSFLARWPFDQRRKLGRRAGLAPGRPRPGLWFAAKIPAWDLGREILPGGWPPLAGARAIRIEDRFGKIANSRSGFGEQRPGPGKNCWQQKKKPAPCSPTAFERGRDLSVANN